MSDKLKSLTELAAIADQARRDHRRVVFTNGCFDLLHRGHVHLLQQAKASGDILIVGINSDRSVRAIKGPRRPILPQGDRVELIGAMEMVDYIGVFDDPDPYALIEAIKPNLLIKGGDWKPTQIIGADVVQREGGQVIVIPYLQGYSTTEIIERIRALNG
ncbi:MAG TPA: D-glycero-beta-D-manno-heptose 1-phosphate adenylyltransferase [Terriglobales bacterium]|nr:D-glycero-beta-D-manno-heptose 1-phosphate adenylyltransferase [Terriglobales bacterium]